MLNAILTGLSYYDNAVNANYKGENDMDQQKDLEYYMNLNYEVIIKMKNERYYLIVEELSIIVEGDTLNEAYEKIHKEKEQYFKKAIESDALHLVKEPQYLVKKEKLFRDLPQFFAKVLIITVIFAFMANVVVGSIIGKLSFNMGELATNSINQIALNSLKQLRILNHRFNTTSESRKEEIRLRLRQKVRQMKPFIDELRVLLEEDGTGGTEKKKSAP